MDRLIRSLVLLVVLALVATACAEDPAVEGEAPDATTGEPAEESPDEDQPADDVSGDGKADLQVADSDVGQVLVDADGMSLYLFAPDEGAGESTCYDECAANWPALTVDGEPVAGDDVDEALLSTTERDDGDTQVVYNGHPLYTFTNDEAPGDTNGQGLNDVWWLVGPDGEPVDDGDDG